MKDKLKETLTNILSYLLKVERRTLLWTNPNPTASFAAQTITIPDISQYNYLEIDTNGGSAVSGFTCRYPVAELLAGNIHWATFIGQGATGLPSVNGRPFKCVSSTQIQFDNGAYWNTSGAQGGLPNVGKPLRIYGIKSGGGTA